MEEKKIKIKKKEAKKQWKKVDSRHHRAMRNIDACRWCYKTGLEKVNKVFLCLCLCPEYFHNDR